MGLHVQALVAGTYRGAFSEKLPEVSSISGKAKSLSALKMAVLLAKAGPIRNYGSASGIAYCRRRGGEKVIMQL